MANESARRWLVIGGALSAAIAILHVAIVVIGAPAYVYFGAPDLAPLAAAGSLTPPLLTLGLALLFGVWSWYGFAGAGLVRRPPRLRIGLWAIGVAYAARGLAVAPELMGLVRGASTVPARYAVFSLVALITGTAYLVGVWRRGRDA
jgi:hypothetical protein